MFKSLGSSSVFMTQRTYAVDEGNKSANTKFLQMILFRRERTEQAVIP